MQNNSLMNYFDVGHTYTHTPIHPYTHTPIHPYTHTSIHPYTHTPIHTDVRLVIATKVYFAGGRTDPNRVGLSRYHIMASVKESLVGGCSPFIVCVNHLYSECVWLYGCVYVRVYGCMVVWVYGCTCVWVYGCMDVWVYGCLDVWMYGVWVYAYIICRVSMLKYFPSMGVTKCSICHSFKHSLACVIYNPLINYLR